MSIELLEASAPPNAAGHIRALRNRDMSIASALKELIDNSLDAGATRVEVGFDKDCITVQDNGTGCLDHEAMVQSGNHRQQKTTQLGMYGVGLKDASAVLADLLNIQSICGDQWMMASVDWARRERVGDWKYNYGIGEATQERRIESGILSGSGTRVRLSKRGKRRNPNKKEMVRLLEELGLTFSPAIRNGKQIEIRDGKSKKLVESYEHPDMEQCITSTVHGPDGLSYKVTAGVLKPGVRNPGKGFIIAYGHRVITSTSEPCREFGGIRFYAFVQLEGNWRLSDHKSSIVENAEWLWDSLYETCRELLEAATEASREVAIAGLEDKVSQHLSSAIQRPGAGTPNAKAIRSRDGETVGTIVPADTGRKHRQANRTQRGDTFQERIGNRKIQVRFEHERGDERIGEVIANSRTITIYLSMEHPYIGGRVAKDDDGTLLHLLCASLLAQWYASANDDDRKAFLPQFVASSERERFDAAMAVFLKQGTGDVQDVRQAV